MSTNPHSHSTIETLPRIHSHQKIQRPPSGRHNKTDRPDTTEEQPTISVNSLRRPRSQSDIHSARKALQSVNTSKAVKLEATTVIYLKKIEALEKQNFILQKQLNETKRDIQQLRLKRKTGEETTSSAVSSRLSSAIRENPAQKLETLRKNIDREHEKTKKTMAEVDKTRREIQTIKKLNKEMQSQLQFWTENMEKEKQTVAELERQIAEKNQLIQQKKIDQIHQKTQIVKQYDAILKKLDDELAENPHRSASDNCQLYLTDLHNQPTPLHRPSSPGHLSPKGSKAPKASVQASFLRSKASEWQGQLQSLQEKLKASSRQELQSKLAEQHSENYKMYNYLNERYHYLDEAKQRYQSLVQKKQGLLKEQGVCTKRQEALSEAARKLEACKEKQNRCTQELHEIDGVYEKLKNFVLDYAAKTGSIGEVNANQITKENLSVWLEQVLKNQKKIGACRS